MAYSDPTIESGEVPSEVPPSNTFTVPVTIKQRGPDPIASDGSCSNNKLNVFSWRTPVELHVDGEEVDQKVLCLAPGNTGTATLSTSLQTGTHDVKVVVKSVGGNAYDFEDATEEINDDLARRVSVVEGADDPSKPGLIEQIMNALTGLTGALGTGSKYTAGLLVLGIVFLFLLPG